MPSADREPRKFNAALTVMKIPTWLFNYLYQSYNNYFLLLYIELRFEQAEPISPTKL